jgi:hypothetical protein
MVFAPLLGSMIAMMKLSVFHTEVPSELRYEIQPIYLTLSVRIVNGKLAFEHYTPGPTFLFVKQ